MVNYLLDLIPFVFADAFEIRKVFQLIMSESNRVKDEGKSAHKAFLTILSPVPKFCHQYLAALYFTLLRVYSVSIP